MQSTRQLLRLQRTVPSLFINPTAARTMATAIAVGAKFPSGITLFEFDAGMKEHKTEEIIGSKGKVIVFGLPGAFTPGCSASHLPSFVKRVDEFKSKGVDEVICVSVNDPFVMAEWGKAHGADGKIKMLADTNAELATALGLTKFLGPAIGLRSQRYSAVVENGIITQLNVEPDGTGLSCSLAPALKL